jgi:hypothetical protein
MMEQYRNDYAGYQKAIFGLQDQLARHQKLMESMGESKPLAAAIHPRKGIPTFAQAQSQDSEVRRVNAGLPEDAGSHNRSIIASVDEPPRILGQSLDHGEISAAMRFAGYSKPLLPIPQPPQSQKAQIPEFERKIVEEQHYLPLENRIVERYIDPLTGTNSMNRRMTQRLLAKEDATKIAQAEADWGMELIRRGSKTYLDKYRELKDQAIEAATAGDNDNALRLREEALNVRKKHAVMATYMNDDEINDKIQATRGEAKLQTDINYEDKALAHLARAWRIHTRRADKVHDGFYLIGSLTDQDRLNNDKTVYFDKAQKWWNKINAHREWKQTQFPDDESFLRWDATLSRKAGGVDFDAPDFSDPQLFWRPPKLEREENSVGYNLWGGYEDLSQLGV